jgi:hypothetical protein
MNVEIGTEADGISFLGVHKSDFLCSVVCRGRPREKRDKLRTSVDGDDGRSNRCCIQPPTALRRDEWPPG